MRNVHVMQGDGSLGLPEQAPFDKILVAAGAPQGSSEPGGAVGGRRQWRCRWESRAEQQLQVVRKIGGEMVTSRQVLCCFVPLIGAEGWEHVTSQCSSNTVAATTMPAAASTIPSIQ